MAKSAKNKKKTMKKMVKKLKDQKCISIREVFEDLEAKPSCLQDFITYNQDQDGSLYKVQNGKKIEISFEKENGRYTCDLMELMQSGNYRDWFIFDHPEMIELENAFNTFVSTNVKNFPHPEAAEVLNSVMGLAIKHHVMRNQADDKYEREYFDIKTSFPNMKNLVESFVNNPVIEIAKNFSNQQLFSFLD